MKKKQISIMLTSVIMMNMITCISVSGIENDIKSDVSQTSKSQIIENINESKAINSVTETYVSNGASESLRPYVKDISKSMISMGGFYRASIGIAGKAMQGSTVYIKLGDEIAEQHIDESRDFGFNINTVSKSITVEIYAIDKNGNQSDSVLVTVTDESDDIVNNGINPNSTPVIEATDITLNKGDSFDPLKGVTAYDEEDGYITYDIEVVENTVNVNKAGKYKVVYKVSDSEGQVTKKEIKVTIVSNEKPVINAKDIKITVGDYFDKLKDITAYDEEDGDLTKTIVVSGEVDSNKVGNYTLNYSVKDSDGNIASKDIVVCVANKEIVVKSVSGINRYETSVELSKLQFESSDTVVIVNGDSLADGLAVTPLAAYKKAPILLSTNGIIPESTKNEIRRLGATNAIIAGGIGVIHKDVENQLKKLGIANIERLGGSNRYDTSLKIAQYIDKNCYSVENIVVSNGLGEADALSISAVAARDKMPIILTQKNALEKETYNWLQSKNLKSAYIIGGEGIISNSVLNHVNEITSENIYNNRLGGSNRYETNAIIIDKFFKNDLNNVYVSKGMPLVDALSAGVVAALNDGPVIIVGNDLSPMQKDIINKRSGNTIIKSGGGISEKSITSLKKGLEKK
ncbi:cell wall-binding repeat-containing protein [Clostridium ihumii]|uniref:cell wall-binding repeat-containing protein n=1 Tax=Clostridium ihumii TaxID=1470356 RepID=UPI003D32AB26